ncbi:MerR family transcriptional regulator [Paenibacillus gansuensis]|uniref:GyrI-like domain-containing protein n=1 Tax=Paenibacillus gansuensis TaxID=306542 RepID=A0ABW5P6R8_9BACL
MLTVGQVARIFNITPKTLRHYDNIGLFSPASMGEENGYRYYTMEQLPELRYIVYLRSMGIGIETIMGLKGSGLLTNPQNIRALLEEHSEAIRAELEAKREKLKEVERMIDYISGIGGIPMEYRLVTKVEFRVTGMKWEPGTAESISQMWGRFLPREHEITGKVEPHIAYGVCVPREEGCILSYYAGYETETGAQVPEGMETITVPAQTYAVFIHKGTAEGISGTFELIYSTWLKQHGLEPVPGMDLEVYGERFYGPMSAESETEIYIPVAVQRG